MASRSWKLVLPSASARVRVEEEDLKLNQVKPVSALASRNSQPEPEPATCRCSISSEIEIAIVSLNQVMRRDTFPEAGTDCQLRRRGLTRQGRISDSRGEWEEGIVAEKGVDCLVRAVCRSLSFSVTLFPDTVDFQKLYNEQKPQLQSK